MTSTYMVSPAYMLHSRHPLNFQTYSVFSITSRHQELPFNPLNELPKHAYPLAHHHTNIFNTRISLSKQSCTIRSTKTPVSYSAPMGRLHGGVSDMLE